jgi:hypothetical protein
MYSYIMLSVELVNIAVTAVTPLRDIRGSDFRWNTVFAEDFHCFTQSLHSELQGNVKESQ